MNVEAIVAAVGLEVKCGRESLPAATPETC